jgi:3-oxoacyl-[acyl-carrier protein] reductase
MSVALVTGASRGIGRAICVALAQAGHSVAINYAGSQSAAEETRALCEQAAATSGASEPQAFATFKADVSDEEQCAALYKQASEQLGTPLILVNNAGITRDNLMLRMPVADFDSVIATNLRSDFMLIKLASRAMIRARAGRIVSIASVVGITGNAGQANYAASKAGVIGLTKSAARELGGKGICVNAVAPGFIDTSMTQVLGDKTKDAMLATIPLKRMGTPEDVARVVRFLVSEDAAYITGQVICVDGGMTI